MTPPVIDGRLTDPAWLEATPVTGFVQRELHEGAPAGEQVRDGDISKGDYFGILLDTYHDRQNGFVFTTTPAGIDYDAQVVNEGYP